MGGLFMTKRNLVLIAACFALITFALATSSVSADPRDVKTIKKGAVLYDGNGKNIGTAIGDHHSASNVQAVIGLNINGNDYILRALPPNLTGPGDARAR